MNSKLHPLRAPFAIPSSYGDVTREVYSPRFDEAMRKRSKELREQDADRNKEFRTCQAKVMQLGYELNALQKLIYVGEKCHVVNSDNKRKNKSMKQNQNQKKQAGRI